MKTKEINSALAHIATLKDTLQQSEQEPEKMALLVQIDSAEKAFQNKYGQKLREVMMDVHDEICPDDKVLSPTEYIADEYHKRGSNYLVSGNQGVKVQSDDFPKEDTKLVLMPNPLRVIVNIDDYTKENVWSAEKESHLY